MPNLIYVFGVITIAYFVIMCSIEYIDITKKLNSVKDAWDEVYLGRE